MGRDERSPVAARIETLVPTPLAHSPGAKRYERELGGRRHLLARVHASRPAGERVVELVDRLAAHGIGGVHAEDHEHAMTGPGNGDVTNNVPWLTAVRCPVGAVTRCHGVICPRSQFQ